MKLMGPTSDMCCQSQPIILKLLILNSNCKYQFCHYLNILFTCHLFMEHAESSMSVVYAWFQTMQWKLCFPI